MKCHGSLYCLLLYIACTDTDVTKKFPKTGKEVFTRPGNMYTRWNAVNKCGKHSLWSYNFEIFTVTTNGFTYAIWAIVICYQYSHKAP
jgi:hypothetical protein